MDGTHTEVFLVLLFQDHHVRQSSSLSPVAKHFSLWKVTLSLHNIIFIDGLTWHLYEAKGKKDNISRMRSPIPIQDTCINFQLDFHPKRSVFPKVKTSIHHLSWCITSTLTNLTHRVSKLPTVMCIWWQGTVPLL